jgi:hypothetical protein
MAPTRAEAKSHRRVGGKQDRSEGANQRAAGRTNETVDCCLQRSTNAGLGNDDGRQHGPVALGLTEDGGQRVVAIIMRKASQRLARCLASGTPLLFLG